MFDFGSNWEKYSIRRLDSDRLAIAAQSLQSLLGLDSLSNASFLDIGCGSGLFSIAAHELGAEVVVGLDINPRCIIISSHNRKCYAPNAPISFYEVSALCLKDLEKLGHFDIVYAWGVLHHTGAMWEAIRNTAHQVSPGGVLVLSIYNKHWTSPIWKSIKWIYNRSPGKIQWVMVVLFSGIIYLAKLLVTGRNPLIKERGMDFWYDVIDWIGGYPYEYAHPDDVTAFVTSLGLNLRNFVPAQVPTGCNEFVFERNV